jgi:hypothetical protein
MQGTLHGVDGRLVQHVCHEMSALRIAAEKQERPGLAQAASADPVEVRVHRVTDVRLQARRCQGAAPSLSVVSSAVAACVMTAHSGGDELL